MMDLKEYIKKNRLNIIVKTDSAQSEIIKWDLDKSALRVNVRAHPEKGEANKEIIKFFKKITKKQVKIVKGLKSREKILEFE